MINTTLVLNYLVPVSLCYNYSFFYDLFFIHPEASVGVLEKRLFEFLEHASISITKKKVLMKVLGNFPVKHSYWSPVFK